MSPILRVTSTSCFFFMVAISDTLFLMISIFDFVEVGIVQGPIFLSVYDSVCRFRWFSKGFIRFCSAWILVLIAIDRWIRTRFPFKVNQLCTRRNALITILITIVLGIGLHGHMLSIQLFGGYFPGIPSVACGPIDLTSFYMRFFFTQWPIIQATQYQDRFCIFRGYLVYAFCAVVICSFLLQAFYRFILVVYPARSNWLSARNQLICIVLTWIYALVFPLAFMFTGDIIYNADNDVCDIPIRLSFALIFLALCVYSIPLSLVMFIYLKLIRYVKQMHKRVTPANILFRVQRELKMTRRVVIMLTSLVPICIPYAIFFILSFFTSLPIYHFRILFTFTGVSFLCTMLIVFKFTDALKLSVMKKLNLRSNTIVPTVGIINQKTKS
ncbi:unnamed protein product [Adineta steineri]|uniref:G-protein coupled receptors family 1 profile domain-containing protein n=1 Tax=Adineta steineri TaxID=433720 RepID=A0A814UBS0_9BILA|nr:unnamed protein product [Adineta steineri]